MALMTVDLTALSPSQRKTCDEVFRSETAAAFVLAKKRQTEIAAHFERNPPRAVDGLGGMNMAFDPFMWCLARHLYQPAPGEDAEVQAWAAKKYPIFRVRHLPTRTQVGYWSTPESRPSFKKTY